MIAVDSHNDVTINDTPTKEWYRLYPNSYIINKYIVNSYSISAFHQQDSLFESRTELDLHAYMVVVGKHVAIIANTGKTVNVKPISSKCNEL